MKRNLLTLVFITLVSLTAGAQAVCKSHKELPKRIDSAIVDIAPRYLRLSVSSRHQYARLWMMIAICPSRNISLSRVPTLPI